MRSAIYQWNLIDGYLLDKLVEGTEILRLPASERVDVSEILNAVASSVRYFIFHLDLSCDSFLQRPHARRCLIDALTGAGIRVINAGVVNITKRSIHRQNRLAGLPDSSANQYGPGDERLIVKTDLNSGGNPEYFSLGRALNPIISGPADYRILARRDIPDEWWSIDELDIERFIANKDDEFYRFYLFGPYVVVSEAWSDREIKRMDGTCPQNNHTLSLAEIVDLEVAENGAWVGAAKTGSTFARSFGLGYGAIDIMRDDLGQFFVIDVNKTPYWGADIENEITVHLRSLLTHDERRC